MFIFHHRSHRTFFHTATQRRKWWKKKLRDSGVFVRKRSLTTHLDPKSLRSSLLMNPLSLSLTLSLFLSVCVWIKWWWSLFCCSYIARALRRPLLIASWSQCSTSLLPLKLTSGSSLEEEGEAVSCLLGYRPKPSLGTSGNSDRPSN